MTRKESLPALILVAIFVAAIFNLPRVSPPTSTTSTTSTSSYAGGSGLTMADELLNDGGRTWLTWMTIPSQNWQAVQLVLTDFGTCPRYSSASQTGADDFSVVGITQSLTSHPVAGSFSYSASPSYAQVNCTPGIGPGTTISFQSSTPAFKQSLPSGSFFSSVCPCAGFSLFGSATVNGQQAIGTYERYTYVSSSDPHPGVYEQSGWVDNPKFTMEYFQTSTYNWAQVWWKDTHTMETTSLTISGTCPSFAYSMPTTRGTDIITLSIARFGTGTCQAGFGFGPATSNLGGAGTSMTNTNR